MNLIIGVNGIFITKVVVPFHKGRHIIRQDPTLPFIILNFHLYLYFLRSI